MIATGLEEENPTAAQSRFGTGSVYRQQNAHLGAGGLKGLNAQPGQAAPMNANPVQGIQKPVDIRSSVEEKTLKIPDFLQRK